MRHIFTLVLILTCFAALFLICYAPALFMGRQFGFRDAAHYYYPLNQRVQDEWNQGRWPLWEPEENSGMPLMGNPTAAVLYPGKLVFAVLPYAWGARVYIVAHSALAFLGMLVLMRGWGITWFGSALSAFAYAFGAPILFQYCNVIYLVGAAWLPLGVHAVDRWVRLGRPWGLLALAVVLSMQVLGGDPQVGYLLGLAAIGYAAGLAWHRTHPRDEGLDSARSRSTRVWRTVILSVIGLALWSWATLMLAQWLPTFRQSGKPTPPLFWMPWVPLLVSGIWGIAASALLVYWFVIWWKHGRRSRLCFIWLGLAASATLSVGLTAAQLFPVIEFTQRTSRAAEGGTHDIYPFSIEPFRLVEVVCPNILGTQFTGNNYWGEMIRIPGARPKAWVPSLYVGGLTLVLALSSLTMRHGPPWRVWFTVIAVVSLMGSLGKYGSPIWVARALEESAISPVPHRLLADLGPIDPLEDTPIRKDGRLRDGDGGFYWGLTHLLPGFRQFRFPAKLFTFTALALAVLGGVGWDRVTTGQARGARAICALLLVLSLAGLVGVVLWREAILAVFKTIEGNSIMGPFDPLGGYHDLVRSLGQAAIVFGLGLALTIVARKRPYLTGAGALVLMTADLAAANSRFVMTVPQSVFESKPEVMKIIEEAERTHPSPGPYRIHRSPIWSLVGWRTRASKDRVYEFVTWERDTIQPKYGINLGVEYTHTLGVAEIYDYEWYFNGFLWKIHDPQIARQLSVELEQEVVYFPRRAYDMWNTRYFIVPYWANRWTDQERSYASIMFDSEAIAPDSSPFINPKGGKEAEKNWIETKDFRVLRNLHEFPRAWVVHDARGTVPFTGLSPETRSEAMEEMLYADDPIWSWRDDTHRAYDPHRLAWVGRDDLSEMRVRLSGKSPKPSEKVQVTYPNPQQAVLEVKLESPGLVVLADIYYPGWKLTIDGKPAQIYRANGVMRGALVDSGPHRLVYTYAPESFRQGLQVSVAALAAFLVLTLACVRWPVDLLAAGEPLLARG
jgi:Bacterial membrane protein YfhO